MIAGIVAQGASLIPSDAFPAPAVFTVEGGWTWFNDPRAIRLGNGVVVGAIRGDGRLLTYGMQSTSPVDLRGSTFQVDDHANLSMLRRSSDGRILVAAAAHNGSGFYTYLSTNPDDPSVFGSEVNIDSQLGLSNYSYSTLIELPGETNDPIFVFFRAGTPDFYFSKSLDQGATWATATKLINNNGDSASHAAYVKAIRNADDRIDFFCTDGSPYHSTTNSIYHFYYEGGSFFETDGTSLTLPFTPASVLAKVYDGTTNRGWIWDAAINEAGNPVCVYAALNSSSNHRYRRAAWNGATWDDEEICAAGGSLYTGEIYYSGGIALDPDDINQVFASREVFGEHQIWRYVRVSGVWGGEQITSGPRAFRPYVIRNAAAEPRLTFMAGNYHSYTAYDTDIRLIDSDTAAVSVPTDSQRSDTCLIVNFHGPAGATSITDYSPDARTMTFRNQAVLSAEASRWGVSAAKFDGSGDAVTAANSADFQFGTADFTLEIAGVGLADWSPATEEFLISLWRTDNNQRGWAVRVTTSGILEFIGTTNGQSGTLTVLLDYDVSALSDGSFHDIAIKRASGQFTLWVDGVQVDSNTVSFNIHAATGLLNIGNIQSNASTWATTSCMNGYVTGVRITNAARTIAPLSGTFPQT